MWSSAIPTLTRKQLIAGLLLAEAHPPEEEEEKEAPLSYSHPIFLYEGEWMKEFRAGKEGGLAQGILGGYLLQTVENGVTRRRENF